MRKGYFQKDLGDNGNKWPVLSVMRNRRRVHVKQSIGLSYFTLVYIVPTGLASVLINELSGTSQITFGSIEINHKWREIIKGILE